MLLRHGSALVVLIMIIILVIPIAAHAPEFPTGNDELERASDVHDPTKSWAIFAQLHEGGEAQYYLLSMRKGENITVSLTAPRSSIGQGFVPSVALMGPGIVGNGTVPPYVQVPDGAGVSVLPGVVPSELEYEPFSPSAFYELGKFSVEAPQDGDYYLAIFENDTGGNYGLSVGLRESFTVEEWVLIPFSALSIYLWEGQSLLMVLAPAIVTFIAGLVVMVAVSRRRSQPVDLLWVVATMSGLVMVASGISLIYQMLWALDQTGTEPTLVVTMLFATLPLALGSAALRIAHRERTTQDVRPVTRATLLIIGALGLALWAGWIIGPVLATVAAVLPGRWLLRRL